MLTRFLILLMLFSCSMKKKRQEEIKKSNIVNVNTKEIYSYDTNLFNILIDYKISNDHFVFIRKSDSFEANVSTTIQLFDIAKDSIIMQESWKDVIVEKEYNDTRSGSKMFEFSKEVSLSEGDYNIKINLQDLDNNNRYSFKNKISLSLDEGFGQVLIYEKKSKEDKHVVYSTTDPEDWGFDLTTEPILEEIKESITVGSNHIRLLFQYFHEFKTIKELKLEVGNYDKKNELSFSDIILNEDGFYLVDFEIPNDYYGTINIALNIDENEASKSFFIYNEKYDLWSQDINEIVGVMRYILPLSEIKLLKEMSVDNKFKYIADFWIEKDPDESTEENELLIEFTNRIKYVNLNFSDFNKGWRTDKGRIYIIYGKPESRDVYSSQSDGIYEIWSYASGMKFTFLDRNGFGNFMLVKQGL